MAKSALCILNELKLDPVLVASMQLPALVAFGCILSKKFLSLNSKTSSVYEKLHLNLPEWIDSIHESYLKFMFLSILNDYPLQQTLD